jgi:hypothetical protein
MISQSLNPYYDMDPIKKETDADLENPKNRRPGKYAIIFPVKRFLGR